MKQNVAHEKKLCLDTTFWISWFFSQWQKLTDMHKKKKYHATLTFTPLHKTTPLHAYTPQNYPAYGLPIIIF